MEGYYVTYVPYSNSIYTYLLLKCSGHHHYHEPQGAAAATAVIIRIYVSTSVHAHEVLHFENTLRDTARHVFYMS